MRDRLFRVLGTTSGRLLVLLALVVAAVNAGAVLVTLTGDFDSYPEAGWWAFRHVVDPGALGDDEEWDQRIVGTGLMFTGVVVFVGIVLALLTEIVQRSVERLDERQVHVHAGDHVVLLGWSLLAPLVLDEMEAIMTAAPTARRRVVVVAPADLRVERDRLQAELRSHHRAFATDLLFAEDDDSTALELARVATARAVLIVRNDTGVHDPLAADLDAIARAVMLADQLSDVVPRPRVTYHVARDQTLATATTALPPDFTPVAGDRAITSVLRMSLAAPPWGRLLAATMTQDAELDLDVVPAGRLAGRRFDELTTALAARLPLGVCAPAGPFSTAADRRVGPDDLIVAVPVDGTWPGSSAPDPEIEITAAFPDELHVLIVGWNSRVPTLIDDLAALERMRIRVTSASDVPAEVRAATLPGDLVERTRCHLLETTLTDESAIRALLERVDPDRVVVVSTLREVVSNPERELPAADARAVITATLLAAADDANRGVVVDLYVPGSAAPLRRVPGVQAVPAAKVQAYTLARLATGPERDNVLTHVFGDDRSPPLIGRMVTGDRRPRTFAAVRATGLVTGVSVAGVVVDETPWQTPPPDYAVPSGTDLLLLRGVDHS